MICESFIDKYKLLMKVFQATSYNILNSLAVL